MGKPTKRLYEVIQSDSPEWKVGFRFYTKRFRNKREILEDTNCKEFIIERQPFKMDGKEIKEHSDDGGKT